MTKRIVIDPITRIEGHLRIEAELDAQNTITEAYSSGTMVRGIETYPQGPRSARRLGLRPAGLRRLHHRARHRLDPGGRGRAGHHHPQGGQPHAQHDDRPAVRARPRDALLSPARARLGGRRRRSEGRPDRDGATSSRRSRPGRTPRPPTSPSVQKKVQAIVDSGQLSHLRQRLLGSPGLQAAARSQPAGRGPLPGGARLAARRHQDPHHLRRQEPAPELRRRRRADARST